MIRKLDASQVSEATRRLNPGLFLEATKKERRTRVSKTRNAGTWTEARYWQAVRSTFRRAFRFWKPAVIALHAARVASPGSRGRKWLFLCAACGRLHLRKNVQIDHVVPAGSLTSPDHLTGFLARLTPEDPKAFQVLCSECHRAKTEAEKNSAE